MNARTFDTVPPLLSMPHTRRGMLGIVLGAALLAQADDQEFALVNLINNYRAENGLNPLVTQSQLMAAAQIHSQDQAASGFNGHTGSDGSTDMQRIERAGYTNWASEAENVYWNSSDGSALAAFTWWKGSPGHNLNMLGDYTEIGVSRAQGPGGWYWTAVFARPW